MLLEIFLFIIVDKSTAIEPSHHNTTPSLDKLLSWLKKTNIRICSCMLTRTRKSNPNTETTSLQRLALYVGMIEHWPHENSESFDAIGINALEKNFSTRCGGTDSYQSYKTIDHRSDSYIHNGHEIL